MKKSRIVIVIILLIIAGWIIFLTSGLNKVSKTEINSIDLSKYPDGTYYGSFDGYRWDNKVEVIVKNHQIVKITIIDDVTFPKDEWSQELIRRVIEKQNVDIEIITGATVTSKAYLKAIENAFKK